MTLLAGCYERFLFGYKCSSTDEAEDGASPGLQRSFTHAAHKGVVKCAAAAGQFAATGGADDLIHLYDLRGDKDLGFLMSPGEGAVTSLAFFAPAGAYTPTHLLSGCADGTLSVWSAGGGWECMKTLRGHRKDVSAISVHPSGMVALTVSRDSSLRMWDLVKGRCTYTSKLEAEAEAVAFSQEDGGARYALLAGSSLTLHSVAGEAGLLHTLAHPRRVLCMAWAPGNRIISGSEDGSLRLWDAQAGVEVLCIPRAHASRVRALALLPTSSGKQQQQQQQLLVATASSDGSIKLWDLGKAAAAAGAAPGGSGGACLAEAQTRARLTCLAAADPLPLMLQRLAAAAAAKQQAAAARQQAAATQPRQKPPPQQQQQPGPKRQKQAERPQQAQVQQQPSPKRQRQADLPQQAQVQQQPGPKRQRQADLPQQAQVHAAAKSKPKPAAAAAAPREPAAAAAAVAPDGVVVRGGVVEFLDTAEEQQRREKKLKQVEQRRRQAEQQGKRFRSMPGEQPAKQRRPQPQQQGEAGGGGGGGHGGAKPQQHRPRSKQRR